MTDLERKIFTDYDNDCGEKETELDEDREGKYRIRADIEYENMMAYYESLRD